MCNVELNLWSLDKRGQRMSFMWHNVSVPDNARCSCLAIEVGIVKFTNHYQVPPLCWALCGHAGDRWGWSLWWGRTSLCRGIDRIRRQMVPEERCSLGGASLWSWCSPGKPSAEGWPGRGLGRTSGPLPWLTGIVQLACYCSGSSEAVVCSQEWFMSRDVISKGLLCACLGQSFFFSDLINIYQDTFH